jgi:hypothetical protein
MADQERKLSDSDIAFVKEQARILAADLAWHARGPVRVHLIGGDGYAFTYVAGGEEGNVISVYLNPKVLFDIKNRERAIAVWRGMGFHELAHHLWPATAQYDAAIKEGFKDLFNLIDDEQNERRGRSRDPEWGSCFQTTVAWVFKKKNTEGEGYVKRWNEFAYHFRRNLPGATEPVVVEALGMIPRNFKDLSKDELLNLTREIHKVLARGVEVPAVIPGAEKEEEAKKPEPPKEPEKKKEPPVAIPVPTWKKLLTSWWAWALMVLCVGFWMRQFTKTGLGGWDEAFWMILALVGVSGGMAALLVWLDRRRKRTARAAGTPSKLPGKWATVKDAAKEGWGKTREAAGRIRDKWLNPVLDALERVTPKPVARFFDWVYRIGRFLLVGAFAIVVGIIAGIWWLLKKVWWLLKKCWWAIKQVGRLLKWVYRTKVFRIMVLSIPVAMLLVMILAVIMKANWKMLLILLLLLLLLALLAWLFRKKLAAFVKNADKGDEEDDFDDDKEMLEFAVINNIVPIEANEAALHELLPDVIPLAQQMRKFLEQCGLVSVDLEDQELGHELTEDLEKAVLGETALCTDEEKIPRASVHIEVGIDCSGSMAGEKIKLAKRFGLLIEESVRGVRGISCNFWGFTSSAIYDCGTPGQYRVSGLIAGGGNNDAAMLWHMYQAAQASGKDLKILLMVSDGSPTECTWGSLHNLVCRLEMAGYIPVQIAVDKIDDPAFKTYYVDLVGQPMASAIIDFGRMLLTLVEQGR